MRNRIASLFYIVTVLLAGPVYGMNVVIDVPNPCVEVDHIEADNIYLRSLSNSCIQTVSKKSVEIEPSLKELNIYFDGRFWKKQPAIAFNMDAVHDRLEEIQGMKDTLAIPLNQHEAEATGKAQNLADFFGSPEFQKRLDREKSRIMGDLFEQPPSKSPYYKDSKTRKGNGLSPSERLYIFISSSVPGSTLREYAAALDLLKQEGIFFVLRGFQGGLREIKPTIRFSLEILMKDRDCNFSSRECAVFDAEMVIDPLLFRKYGIEKVPAFVYVPRITVTDPEMSEGIGENAAVNTFYALYGDVSVEYAVERLYKETGEVSLKGLLALLRDGFYR